MWFKHMKEASTTVVPGSALRPDHRVVGLGLPYNPAPLAVPLYNT